MIKKVLITGSAGFIGFHLTSILLEQSFFVIGVDNLSDYYDVNLKKDRLNQVKNNVEKLPGKFVFHNCDIADKKEIGSIFEKYNPNYVVNLAAQAGVRYSITNPSAYIQSNIVGFLNILEFSKDFNIEHLLYASSSSVYGGNEKVPFKETDSVDHPISLYAASKKSNELMAHTYSNLYKLPATGLRFFTVYGPWGRPDMALFLFTKSILENKPIKVFNNGDMVRDFTYVDDIVKALSLLIKKPATSDPDFDKTKPNPSRSWNPHMVFNIGNSKPVKLMEYISLIEKETGKKAVYDFQEMQPGDVRYTESNTEALNKWIGYKPETTVEEGIKNFVDWYRDYYSI